MVKVFERNPRNVRIASWMIALGLCVAWYQYDRKKEREFSPHDAKEWNEAILRMHPQKPRQKKNPEKSD
ncbi:hypothetical protein PsorP6_011871 [Peronosclerospora sorghi]|uniref:Uncharacterized protein n=1 Tax=Peronosclerospora sorghi TaxID=230839 RepID=A0ACC0WK94_9STRA|nr:hypothetical protein PsorP6_011871 [Peronosclerospora sorghi]